jgi:predicted extracellular nuclease
MKSKVALPVAAGVTLLVLIYACVGVAAISVPTVQAYIQNFDGMGVPANATTASTLPADFRVDATTTSNSSDVRKVGSFATAGTATARAGGANLSTSAANGIYNFGAGSATLGGSDRAVGFLASGTATASGNLYAQLINNTGTPLSGLQISYNVEKYRNGSNAAGFHIQLFYSTDGSTWTSAGNNFLTSFARDTDNSGFSNAPGATVAVSNQLLSAAIPVDGNFYLAWNYSVSSGSIVTNAQALAVDDISILGVQGSATTNPAATGTASPSTVQPGDTPVLSATVTAGTNPDSTGLVVSCNLSSLGGPTNFSLLNSGGNVYSASYTIPLATPAQTYSVPCVVTDDQSRSGNFNVSLTVTVPFICETGIKTSTAIHTIQGSGTVSPMAGQTVDVEGVVVGNFRLSTQLNGFYLQEPDATWDSDPLTSEGIFIFDNGAGANVAIGDRVRVKGVVNEFSSSGSFLGSNRTSSLTEIANIQSKLVCSSGNSFTRTAVSLPTAAFGDLERFEGMAVQISQPLAVTGNFSLGTFDQLDLASSVLYVPTMSADPMSWPAQADLISRSVIALDDGSTLANANLYPTIFPQGGLSATNTLRVGAAVNYDTSTGTNSPLVGVLDDRFGEYRIQPTAPVAFFETDPRPDIAPIIVGVGGRFRAVSANVLNFFTTLGSRGAANQSEFDGQKTKIIEELSGMDADVYGLSEVQNFANGNTNGGTYTNVALQSLVDGLNCKKSGSDATCSNPPAAPYGFIDTLPLGSANGSDAIRSAIIYRLDRLVPVGGPALYNQNDTNRPTLAQTFQPASGSKAAQQSFSFVVNHFRSKGSACGGSSDDPFQGNCNGLRLNMAQNVVAWLANNPTSDPAGVNRRILVVGDFNAYFGEDPIQYFIGHGYSNLIAAIIGPTAYSYNFGSQNGYLDHAMVNPAMNPLIRNVAEWHNNSPEPASLEALDTSSKSAAAQVAYYASDPYAASDHDPIVIGFNTLLGDLNDDGVVDATDQLMVTSAIGKNASAVDRRMDYDGDGRITLNDYRIWVAYYRAFIQ